MKSKDMTTPYMATSISRSPLRRAFAVIALVLACFALSAVPKAFGDSGTQNAASGSGALSNNTTGSDNTATGFEALYNNTTGFENTANGSGALFSVTTAQFDTAIGFHALYGNTSGQSNTAVGSGALSSVTTASSNTATGSQALNHNTGASNTAAGSFTLFNNTTGTGNTAVGAAALNGNTTGGNNIALGISAGINLTTGSNNIHIGNTGLAAESNTIRVGTQGIQGVTFVAGISGTPVVGSTVVVTSSGQLGVSGSSKRFKNDIKSMDKASETILSLRPVTFRYKPGLDPNGIPQFGLVAEEVEKVNPALVVRDADGKPYTVRYEAVNAMLLNEFLKEHQTVQDLKTTVAQQQKQIEVLAAGLQKVSAQLEVSKPQAQVASNRK
jgi:endosialidase-like protein